MIRTNRFFGVVRRDVGFRSPNPNRDCPDEIETVGKYSTVGCRRTWGTWSQPRSFLFFKTPANLVLIFQSVFESRWLACSAHTVGDDACRAGKAAEMFQTVELESFHSQQCRRRSRLHSKRCLGVVRLFLQPGVVLIFDEIPAWPFFGKPFFGTRQYCMLRYCIPSLFCKPVKYMYMKYAAISCHETLYRGEHSH